jgi:hypothetical protein
VDFTLRATTRFSGVLIRAQCGGAAAPGFSPYTPDMTFWLANNEPLNIYEHSRF